MGTAEVKYLLPVIKSLRERGISCELYPDQSKLKKQFDYASKKNIPYLSINGENEVNSSKVNIKNLITGEQNLFERTDIEKIVSFLSGN